jgi:predicted lipid carrier protein YhbT
VTVARFLSQEWLDLQRELGADLPGRPGATARLQYVVTGGPDGEVAYVTTIDDGRTTANQLGTDDQCQITVTSTYADSVLIAKGELDPNAAFMQGRIKVAGDMGKLMAILPLVGHPDYAAVSQQLADQTEF